MSLFRVIRKFGALLSSHQKFRVFELTILMIIGGLVEMCSVSLVLPFMSAIIDPEAAMEKWYSKIICNSFNIESSQNYMVLIAIGLAILYVLKNAFLLFEMDIQYRFVYGNMFAMQKRLLDNIIHRPYEYYLKIDSGEIIRLVNSDTPATFNLLQTLLSLFSEIVVSLFLIATIFIITPNTTLYISMVILALVLVINYLIKPIMQKVSKENMAATAGMNKWLLQALQGIKEIKVMKKEGYFQSNYDVHGVTYVETIRKSQILGFAPRFIIEAASMGTMFLVIAVLIYRGNDLNSIIPMLSAVMMAALRLLPSVNRITNSLAQITYNEGRLDKLLDNLKALDEYVCCDNEQKVPCTADSISGFYHEIGLHGITYRYEDSRINVLDNAEIIIKKGESVGLIGSSGSGKSTTVDIVLGLLRPQKGKVTIDGIDIYRDIDGWLDCVGYIPQSIFLLDDSIKANVAFGSEIDVVNEEDVWRALEEASLSDFVKSLPQGIETQIGERGVRLSGGQRQRIGIARALYQNPSVLFFDEATSALDNETEKEIMESINNLRGNKTMIIIAHRLTTIENCDAIYRVENGTIRKL